MCHNVKTFAHVHVFKKSVVVPATSHDVLHGVNIDILPTIVINTAVFMYIRCES
jgi:hypothetical protein